MDKPKKKEFWQMTRVEVSSSLDIPDETVVKSVLSSHEKAVRQALNQGKDVPGAVLKDYPAIDKPRSSGIMTSREVKEDERPVRVDEPKADDPVLGRDGDTQHSGVGRQSPQLHQAEQAKGIPEDEQKGVAGVLPSESHSGETLRREPDGERRAGLHSVEPGDQAGNIGERDRLTPEPKDVVLTESSDIGYNAGPWHYFVA